MCKTQSSRSPSLAFSPVKHWSTRKGCYMSSGWQSILWFHFCFYETSFYPVAQAGLEERALLQSAQRKVKALSPLACLRQYFLCCCHTSPSSRLPPKTVSLHLLLSRKYANRDSPEVDQRPTRTGSSLIFKKRQHARM